MSGIMPRTVMGDRRGVAAVEFGIVLVPLLMVVLGAIELGYQVYVKSVTAGAMETAIRDISLGNKTAQQVSDRVKADLGAVVARQHVETVTRSFTDFASVASAEKLTDDKNSNGTYDKGDCFRDTNDNGRYDTAATAGRANAGGAEDVVSYTITVSYPHLFPVQRLLGMSDRGRVSINAVMRNQPFAKATAAKVVCA